MTENTILIFTSDNGPVVDDGYKDLAVELLNGHKPAGSLRGGKYSAFDAGTRVPFLVRWPGQVKPGESDALVCQIDLLASMAAADHSRTSGAYCGRMRPMLGAGWQRQAQLGDGLIGTR